MPALVSSDTDAIINTTSAFLSQDNQYDMQHDVFGYVIQLAPLSVSDDAKSIVSGTVALCQGDQNEVQHDFLAM